MNAWLNDRATIVDYAAKFGGDTMNTAIYLRQLTQENCQISFITAMGNDPLSNAMIAMARKR